MHKILLNAQEVAHILNVSRALAYRWMGDGTLPALRAPRGRVVRVPREALEAWIREHTHPADGTRVRWQGQREDCENLPGETNERGNAHPRRAHQT